MTYQYEKNPVPQSMLHDGQSSKSLQQSGSVLTFTEIRISPTQCQGRALLNSKQRLALCHSASSFRRLEVPQCLRLHGQPVCSSCTAWLFKWLPNKAFETSVATHSITKRHIPHSWIFSNDAEKTLNIELNF